MTSRPARSELGEVTRASAEVVDAVAETVELTHRAIASRVFRAVGPIGAPVRIATETTTHLIYRAVRGGLRGAAGVLGAAADHHPRLRALRPTATRRGSRVLAAASGIVGDTVAERAPGLDLGMELRHEGRPLPLTTDRLRQAHPQCSGRLVVFVHGLCEHDRSWWRQSRVHRAARRAGDEQGAAVASHGQRLADARGATPLYVRYNTGRPVHASGRSLAVLLEAVLDAWPVEVERLALVGHSMGGLVARAACHHGLEASHRWPHLVDDIVYLGTPHLGAPLARGVDAAARVLARVPETRGLTSLLERRSAGVRDLQRGDVADARAAEDLPEAMRETAGDPPPLPDARHHLVVATVTRDPGHPVGRLLGDGLVRADSGSGRSRSRQLGFGDEAVVMGGIDHFDLLSDPGVGELLMSRLAVGRADYEAVSSRAISMRHASATEPDIDG